MAVFSLAFAPVLSTVPAHAAESVVLSVAEAVTRLSVNAKSRDGYARDVFKHWNAGADPADGCNTRNEVFLAEAWDSGASAWTAARREAYANDLGQDASLVAVTARSNRSKADQDPSQWLPPAAGAVCRYVSEWTATKLRWNLTADQAEQATLRELAGDCTTSNVIYEPA